VKTRFWWLACCSVRRRWLLKPPTPRIESASRMFLRVYLTPFPGSAKIPAYSENMDLTRKSFLSPGSPRVVQALLAGDLEYAVAGATPAIRARMGGADAVILASLSSVSNMKLMVHPKSGIKRIADLKGKVLGVSQYGSEADVVARIMISHASLAPRDVNILQLGGLPRRLSRASLMPRFWAFKAS
jgi:hypothetical protein